jgi:hypothetical protein
MKITENYLASLGFKFDTRGHFQPFVSGLLESGFSVSALPADGFVKRNGQIVVLDLPDRKLKFRVYIYKVTVSSRGRPYERRVEITNTYEKGNIRRFSGARDVVLGWDYKHKVFVGLDAARLGHGGLKGNASSFFDAEGLELASRQEMLIRPHRSSIFKAGYEYHAFFERSFVGDYLACLSDIHCGQYRGDTFFAGKTPSLKSRIVPDNGVDQLIFMTGRRASRKGVSRSLIEAIEKESVIQLKKRRVSTKEFEEVKKTCE